MHSFEPPGQPCRGNAIFSEVGTTVLVKWSKTNQERQQIHIIAIPKLGESMICPVRVLLKSMITLFPAEFNDPLFMLHHKHQLASLTDSVARKHLKSISKILGVH